MDFTMLTLFATALIFLIRVRDGWSSPLELFKLHDGDECKDEREDCDRIPAKGEELKKYCEKWKARGDQAVMQCRKTCGWCKAPFPPIVKECKDQRDDCNWIVVTQGPHLDAYCQRHKHDAAVKMCGKTCGFCKKSPSPTILPTKQPRPPIHPVTPPPPTPSRPQTQAPKPATTKKPTGSGMTGFQTECLIAHNRLRALHHSPALVWSHELAEDAQYWANILARDNSFEHFPKLREFGQGENLAWFSPANTMCNGPSDKLCVHCGAFVKDWYDEIKDYSFSNGKGKEPWSVYLHFTQVVWKGSTELGMATAQAHDRVVAVARYRKAGNQGSSEVFKRNVLRPEP